MILPRLGIYGWKGADENPLFAVYTHVPNKGGKGVRSHVDNLWRSGVAGILSRRPDKILA